MSEYRLAEKPAMEVLAALTMRVKKNGVIPKPLLIKALRQLGRVVQL